MKAKIIEKDYLTEKHMLRIKQVAEDFAEKLELTHKQKSDLLLVTELHDIG
jgi:response regulator RpfG family c-di-GMP phosphodiesterase